MTVDLADFVRSGPWRHPTAVLVHDFPTDAEGKCMPQPVTWEAVC